MENPFVGWLIYPFMCEPYPRTPNIGTAALSKLNSAVLPGPEETSYF